VPLWPVPLAGARFQLRPVHRPPWGSMVRCCARSLQPFCSMWNLRMASTVANPRKILPPGAPGVMNVDRGDLARQLRWLGQQAKLRRGNPTDRRWH
jgi:hypothetical protein